MMDAPDLQHLQELDRGAIVSEVKGGQIRLDALREIAIGIGARGGLNKRNGEIKDRLETHSKHMDRVFDFRPLLISAPAGISQTTQYYILPPVITEGRNALKTVDALEIHAADKVFKIEAQAKFVTNPPTWKEYLSQPTQPVETPDATLLPRDSNERAAWKRWVEEGWKIGYQQADAIFDLNMSRLERDYQGMLRYKTLLKQNIVSKPFVAEARLGVVGGGDDLEIDSRQLRITALPLLNTRAAEWKPTAYAIQQPAPAVVDVKPKAAERLDVRSIR
ncbi:type IV secretory system conjugative DNA transfer family protein [Methylobacillus sp. Pita2]|uniref:type IV secretory system conjugative DNA transfer family protein n=1 Tax=Methylobacillus sp. Pita2 TaxID=3383245 RepID=UPI0038B4FF7F